MHTHADSSPCQSGQSSVSTEAVGPMSTALEEVERKRPCELGQGKRKREDESASGMGANFDDGGSMLKLVGLFGENIHTKGLHTGLKLEEQIRTLPVLAQAQQEQIRALLAQAQGTKPPGGVVMGHGGGRNRYDLLELRQVRTWSTLYKAQVCVCDHFVLWRGNVILMLTQSLFSNRTRLETDW